MNWWHERICRFINGLEFKPSSDELSGATAPCWLTLKLTEGEIEKHATIQRDQSVFCVFLSGRKWWRCRGKTLFNYVFGLFDESLNTNIGIENWQPGEADSHLFEWDSSDWSADTCTEIHSKFACVIWHCSPHQTRREICAILATFSLSPEVHFVLEQLHFLFFFIWPTEVFDCWTIIHTRQDLLCISYGFPCEKVKAAHANLRLWRP